MPRCADPHRYWPAILTRIRSAGDNASSANGLSVVLLAVAPLKEIPGLLRKLTAEVKQTAHSGTPFKQGQGS
jgi:hypothetical protein